MLMQDLTSQANRTVPQSRSWDHAAAFWSGYQSDRRLCRLEFHSRNIPWAAGGSHNAGDEGSVNFQDKANPFCYTVVPHEAQGRYTDRGLAGTSAGAVSCKNV